ncbi:MAG: hypothetical protein ACREQW_19470 [Candidatus Binatia bacterium]
MIRPASEKTVNCLSDSITPAVSVSCSGLLTETLAQYAIWWLKLKLAALEWGKGQRAGR